MRDTSTPHTIFPFTITSDEGATFTPWTDGYAIGYRVTAPGLPDRYVILNPSDSQSSGDALDTDVCLYHSTTDAPFAEEPVCVVNIWDVNIWNPRKGTAKP